MHRAITAIICCLALLVAPEAMAAKRVALVVGIDAYDNLAPADQLRKAVSDAQGLGETLRTIGYQVIDAENADRRGFNENWQKFLSLVEPGDEAAFFFAGHGVEIAGQNYLLPRDVPKPQSGEAFLVKNESLSVAQLLSDLQDRSPRVSLIILDACRDNPFAADGTRSVGATRGLARVDAPEGTFVIYSAGTGQAALDRLSDSDANANSVFTRSLMPLLKTPGLRIQDIALKVRDEVAELAQSAGFRQRPAYYDELSGGFCPAGCEAHAEGSAAEPSSPSVNSGDVDFSNFSMPPMEIPGASSGPGQVDTPLDTQKVAIAAISKLASPYKGGETFKDCPECPEMVVIPAGEFLMGSRPGEKDSQEDESPDHRVQISLPFAVGRFEVTKDQFLAFVNDSGHGPGTDCKIFATPDPSNPPSFRNPGFRQSGNDPVVCVSWNDATAYTTWLSRKTGKSYRLPSEAEWEYAARGGSRKTSEGSPCDYGNGADLSARTTFSILRVANCSDGYVFTAPVGTFAANGFGLYDMQGNVWEWVGDCYHWDYNGSPTDGSAWTLGGDCSSRVFRGGAFTGEPGILRLSSRSGTPSSYRSFIIGFRVARTLSP